MPANSFRQLFHPRGIQWCHDSTQLQPALSMQHAAWSGRQEHWASSQGNETILHLENRPRSLASNARDDPWQVVGWLVKNAATVLWLLGLSLDSAAAPSGYSVAPMRTPIFHWGWAHMAISPTMSNAARWWSEYIPPGLDILLLVELIWVFEQALISSVFFTRKFQRNWLKVS